VRIHDAPVTIDELKSSAVNDPDGIIGAQDTMFRCTALGVADSRGILNVLDARSTIRLGKGELFDDDSSILESPFLGLAGNHLLSPRRVPQHAATTRKRRFVNAGSLKINFTSDPTNSR